MKYILRLPLRFIWYVIVVIGYTILTICISMILILWHFDLSKAEDVKEFFFSDEEDFYTDNEFDGKQFSYKTFWDAVHGRKTY